MSDFRSIIERSAREFAETVLNAVRGATLDELLSLQGNARTAKGVAKRGRPPKAKPGRKPGRPRKAAGKKILKKVAKAPAKKKRKINYPKCSVPGCGKNRWARGNGMCGEHFKASTEK